MPCSSAFSIVKHIVISSAISSFVTVAVTVNRFVTSSPPYPITSIGSGESRTKS